MICAARALARWGPRDGSCGAGLCRPGRRASVRPWHGSPRVAVATAGLGGMGVIGTVLSIILGGGDKATDIFRHRLFSSVCNGHETIGWHRRRADGEIFLGERQIQLLF